MKVSSKRILIHCNFYYKHFNCIKKKKISKNMQTIKDYYVLVKISYISVKYWLDFTKAENKNQYLTNLTDNITF